VSAFLWKNALIGRVIGRARRIEAEKVPDTFFLSPFSSGHIFIPPRLIPSPGPDPSPTSDPEGGGSIPGGTNGIPGNGYGDTAVADPSWWGWALPPMITVLRTGATACALEPWCWGPGAVGAVGGLAIWDGIGLYHLAQAHGHFLPKAKWVPPPLIMPHPPEVVKACSDALDTYLNKARRGGGDPGSCYRECIGAGGIWPTYKCPL
jgi:hypothetical protein